AAARRADFVALKTNILFDAGGRFFERQLDITAHIGAAPRTSRTPTAAEQIAENAAPEDISECVENVLDAVEISRGSLNTRVTVAIVARTLFGIAEHLVGFRGKFEFLRGLGVVGMTIRVITDGHFAIGRRDLGVRCRPGYPEYFVVVPFGSHRRHGTPSFPSTPC